MGDRESERKIELSSPQTYLEFFPKTGIWMLELSKSQEYPSVFTTKYHELPVYTSSFHVLLAVMIHNCDTVNVMLLALYVQVAYTEKIR